MDLGDGQPFGVAVKVLHVEQCVATVRDNRGHTYRAHSLIAVGLDGEAVILAEEERQAKQSEMARRARCRSKTTLT